MEIIRQHQLLDIILEAHKSSLKEILQLIKSLLSRA